MNLVHEASEPGASRATSDQPGECAGASGTGRYGLTWIVNAVVVPVPLEATTDVGPYHGNRVPQTLLERDSATVCSDIRQGAIDVTEVTRGKCVGALDTGELGAVEDVEPVGVAVVVGVGPEDCLVTGAVGLLQPLDRTVTGVTADRSIVEGERIGVDRRETVATEVWEFY